MLLLCGGAIIDLASLTRLIFDYSIRFAEFLCEWGHPHLHSGVVLAVVLDEFIL
jgi:hypothetical protein